MGRTLKWSEIQYVECAVSDTRVDAYLETLRALYVNGQVLFRCFQPTDAVDFQNACRHDLSGLDNFITAFLSASSVQTIIDELQLPLIVRNTPNYHYYSTYEMEGALTVSLLQGGAYKKFAGSEEKARRLARDVVNVIGHEHTEVFKIVGAWTPWFYDVAWDCSFIIFNRPQMKCWILCMTDTN